MDNVMQRRPHGTQPRFFINCKGELIDRGIHGRHRRTGFSIEANRASRSEMRILAEMLNDPEQMAEWDAGADPTRAWAARIHEQQLHERLLAVEPGYRRLHDEIGGRYHA